MFSNALGPRVIAAQTSALILMAGLSGCFGRASAGAEFGPASGADTGSQTDASSNSDAAASHSMDDDSFVPKPLNLPSKCNFKDKSCISTCMDNKCAGLEAACDAIPDCKKVSSCVKSKSGCHWRAWDCIHKCIYKTYSTKGGKAYLALTDCAAKHCIVQDCGDGICFGAETPQTCPRDCRAGTKGPGTCAKHCGNFSVVPNNVAVNLEVRATSGTYAVSGVTHSNSHLAGSKALNWVIERLAKADW